MKRLISISLSLFILVACLSAIPAFATTDIDYSYIKENSDIYSFDINDDGNALIDLNYSKPVFTHENSLEDYYSFIYSDIIVTDYYKSPHATWRIWIYYVAAKSIGISSVSFTMGDTEYIFDVDTQFVRTDDYVLEAVPIVCGLDNIVFLLDLLNEINNEGE